MTKKTNDKKATNKIKEAGKPSVVGLVISSILINSCAVDPTAYNNENNIYGNINTDQTFKKDLLNINELQLSAELLDYANVINIIIDDITNNSKSAELFCSDPDGYIKQHDLGSLMTGSIKFEITDHDKRLLRALTDEDVMNTVRARDFRNFVNVCVSKGYFSKANDIMNVNFSEYRKFFKSEEDFNKYREMIKSINTGNNVKTRSDGGDEFLIGVPVGAVGFAVVEIGVGVDMATVAHQYTSVSGAEAYSTPLGNRNEPVMKLWYNENTTVTPDEKTIFYDELIAKRVEEMVETICEEFPQVDKNALRNFIVINFKNYYGYK